MKQDATCSIHGKKGCFHTMKQEEADLKYSNPMTWKDDEDPIKRLVFFIAGLSPHNFWKGYEAIARRKEEVNPYMKKEKMKEIIIRIIRKHIRKGAVNFTGGYSFYENMANDLLDLFDRQIKEQENY